MSYMVVRKIIRRSGQQTEEIPGSPLFESHEEAVRWAADFMARPDFPRGFQAIEVRKVIHIPETID